MSFETNRNGPNLSTITLPSSFDFFTIVVPALQMLTPPGSFLMHRMHTLVVVSENVHRQSFNVEFAAIDIHGASFMETFSDALQSVITFDVLPILKVDVSFAGVTLIFNYPREARKPDLRFKLYVFKAGEVLNGNLLDILMILALFLLFKTP